MKTLVDISIARELSGTDETVLAVHRVKTMPVIVISPHNQCNCRCAMCDIWRIQEPQQLTLADLERQQDSFRGLGVRWVVFSGGEAQLNPQLFTLAQMLRGEGIRITLLTAGLLLEAEAASVARNIDDVIVSLDGPPALHNAIRRVPSAFEKLATGIEAIRRIRPDLAISARCTVQKANHQALCETVRSAKKLGLNSISFLAVDVSSDAFNRASVWSPERQDRVALSPAEVESLAEEVERLINEQTAVEGNGFVAENPAKLRRIVLHFRAHLGQAEHVAPRCNAPWVSAVIEPSGNVRPCFFHPKLGNIHDRPLQEIVNGSEALQFRANLDVSTNPVCRRCVCSLHIQPLKD
jgi:Fe-coproporphyrin III synthase